MGKPVERTRAIVSERIENDNKLLRSPRNRGCFYPQITQTMQKGSHLNRRGAETQRGMNHGDTMALILNLALPAGLICFVVSTAVKIRAQTLEPFSTAVAAAGSVSVFACAIAMKLSERNGVGP